MKLYQEILPIFLIVASAAYGWVNKDRLPEQVPIHFNAQGEPDNWMGRGAAIWLAPGFALFFWVAFLIIRGLYAAKVEPVFGSLFIWETLFVFMMANVQVMTVLYATDRIKAPVLGILPSLILLIGYAVWHTIRVMMMQGKP